MAESGNLTAHQRVIGKLRDALEPKGLEVADFKVGWYNSAVSRPFHFPYHDNTLAVLVASAPSMFESLFLPWLADHYRVDSELEGAQLDPLDRCFKGLFARLKSLFPGEEDFEAIHDFELHPGTRRPKVLVQTAGHVAGYAYYYQRKDVQPDPWDKDKKMYGVSVHPRYGGWFAFRGVLIFKGLLAPELKERDPVDCVSSWEKRKELLQEYNFNWQEWKYRDVIDGGKVVEQYSEEQKRYFGTEPSKRFDLIPDLIGSS